ncbi:MAG TPA: hypothetical protein VG795_02165, partial [Acidimicrobiia bacterium]|nr:hypothetical protein [Acidimicrobiia bacterium]
RNLHRRFRMSDPAVPTQRAQLSRPAESDAFHRLTSRLAILDLDPATLEMLTAVLNADIDPREAADALGLPVTAPS